ncbi:MAG: hypothetical protein OMM_07702 [Candidatus Magnetoglobus multicellularis str. Araruama]|uniref:Fibronectin type-III domain-containing protein n=1 Tax=Candidatus Magnetoglobus multicellularis str. Araruama TaxID=890399 RepID=A0A1V1PB31_9BACT|nr:MAG: hypothetical protein OMM_07702 [Candidatus Magnetoglobus multicellularis str. Araruama]
MTWVSAKDTETISENIAYMLYSSTINHGLDLLSWENNASPVTSWANHLTRMTISPLNKENVYYFTVIAKDESGNKVLYDSIEVYVPIFVERTDISFPGLSHGDSVWGDYDQDGDLDLFICGSTGSSIIAKIYRNDSGNFVDIGASLTGLSTGQANWGDYDNDGDLDLIITGKNESDVPQTILYKNANGIFVDSGFAFSGLKESSAIWGDCDNDGDLDFIITGQTSSNDVVNILYTNNGGAFSNSSFGSGQMNSSLDLRDFKNDYYLDILITGYNSNFSNKRMTAIYNNYGSGYSSWTTNDTLTHIYDGIGISGDFDNDGNIDIFLSGKSANGNIAKICKIETNSFEDINATITPLDLCDARWADYDNDGDLDLFVTGRPETNLSHSPMAFLYRNDHGVFTSLNYSHLAIQNGSIDFGDYDNDGDLDLFITGIHESGFIAKLYDNRIESPNIPPSAPEMITTTISGSSVTLDWTDATDNETPSPGLTYQLMVGTSPGGIDIKAPMALPLSNGYRLIPQTGLINTSAYLLKNLSDGLYYWRVQAIDTSFAGSAFSNEYSFTIDVTPPTPGNSGNITPEISDATSMTITWDLASDAHDLDSTIHYQVYYSTNNYGTDINQWENNASVVKSWTKNLTQVEISNLAYGNTYYATIITIDSRGNKAIYSPATISTALFIEDTRNTFAGVNGSSVAFGDYDGDMDLDIIISGMSNTGNIVKIYQNNNGLFEDTGFSFPGIEKGEVAWGDYDQDGDLDLVITGSPSIAKIYQNNQGNFVDIGAPLMVMSDSDAAWGDYDSDGDLDLIISGQDSSGVNTYLYTNENGTFHNSGEQLLGVYYHCVTAWADYDRDSDLDLLISGMDKNDQYNTKMFQNNSSHLQMISTNLSLFNRLSADWGDFNNDTYLDLVMVGNSSSGETVKIFENDNGSLIEINTGITGVDYGDSKWGDYDNDGDLDLIIAGNINSVKTTRIYQNQNGNFVNINAQIANVSSCDIAWGDIDQDHDLDLLITGYENTQRITKLYKNMITTPNTKPSPPDNLFAQVSGSHVLLSWTAGTDSETPASGLNYNLRIGTTPKGIDIMSPMSLPLSNGFRLIPARGHIQCLTATVNLKNTGTYYWSVQSIDTAFAGSEFAPEGTFTVTDLHPIVSNEMITSLSLMPDCVTLTWTPASDADTSSENLEYMAYSSTTSYELNIQAWERNARPVASWTGALTRLYIDGLIRENTYFFNIIVSDPSGNQDIYQPIEISAPTFIKRKDIFFTGFSDGDCQWGDYDQDGDLDIVVIGATDTSLIATIYRNDNGNSFTDSGSLLTGLSTGKLAWGDYDNDGDLDLIMTGQDNTGAAKTILYHNNNGSVADSGISFTGLKDAAVKWGDNDNDGDLDLITCGLNDANQPKTYLYENDGAIFNVFQSGLPDVYKCSLDWADINNDGDYDLDVFITGYQSSGTYAHVYFNYGSGNYSYETHTTTLYDGIGIMGDFDNDRDMDVFISGHSSNGKISHIYQNTSTSSSYATFTNLNIAMIGLDNCDAAWADYDNDGDLDLFVTGLPENYVNTNPMAFLYRNDSGNFVKLNYSHMAVKEGSIAFGDFDNDGDLDLFVAGMSRSGLKAHIYENIHLSSNTKPAAPANLTASPSGSSVYLDWDDANDSQTSHSGVKYQLMVGTSSDTTAIKSPMSNSNGYRCIVQSGDINLSAYQLKNLPDGNYYWRVQAIDTAFDGSSFSSQSTFRIDTHTPTPGQSGNISAVTVRSNSIGINWMTATDNLTSENNLQYRVFTSTSNYGTNINEWESYGDAQNNWSGNLSSYDCSNLNVDTQYYIAVIVKDANGNQSIYNTISKTTRYFFEDQTIQLSGVTESFATWVDYDTDQDYDLFVLGKASDGNKTVLYQNTNGTLTPINTSLPDVSNGAADWGDFDKDGDPDLIISGDTGSGWITQLFINDNGNLTYTNVVFPGVTEGAVAWGDYDSDWDLDILIAGNSDYGLIAKIYQNENGHFSDSGVVLPGIYQGSVDWGDYDKDNDLDLLITGNSFSGPIGGVYRNDNGSFVQSVDLVDVASSAASWGDYDEDGDLDIVIAGYSTSGRITYIYNNASGSFTHVETLTGIDKCAVAWGDYNNDGDLDLAISGYTDSGRLSRVFSYSSSNFVEMQSSFIGVDHSTLAWGDYDNDGNLDLFVAGINDNGLIAKIYHNYVSGANSTPSPPYNLSASVNGLSVDLNWNAYDSTTSSNAITFDLCFGSSQGAMDIASPMATINNGFRFKPEKGVIQMASTTIHNLTLGTYYWRVQAIDASFSGSAFSNESSFVLSDTAPPVPGSNGTVIIADHGLQDIVLNWSKATDLIAADATLQYRVYYSTYNYGSSIYNWENYTSSLTAWTSGLTTLTKTGLSTDYNYYFAILVRDAANNKAMYDIISTDAVSPTPGNNGNMTVSDYTANSVSIEWTGATDNLAAQNELEYRVFYSTNNYGSNTASWENNATAATNWSVNIDNASINNLTLGQSYYFAVLVRDKRRNTAMYSIVSKYTTPFRQSTLVSLSGVIDSSMAWGDYDADGDLDFAMTGMSPTGSIARIYQNNGNSFSDINASLPGVVKGNIIWADYDADNDLDLLMTGFSTSGRIAKIYQNTGTSFSDTSASLTPVYLSDAAFGDYDNDGDLDLLIAGNAISGRQLNLYQNNNGLFSDSGQLFPGVQKCALAWGDYDNDADLDFIVIGESQSEKIAILYQNTNGIFQDSGEVFPGVIDGAVAWGDYDNDGDLDLAISGQTDSGNTTLLYQNTNGSFSDSGVSLPGLQMASIQWGDFDADGDLDLFISGKDNTGNILKLYQNTNGNFSNYDLIDISGINASDICWGDFQNDGALDFLISGETNSGAMAKLYENILEISNSLPSAPTDLTATVEGNAITLAWTVGSDNETQDTGLSYNVQMGTSSGAFDVIAPMALALTNGYRQIPSRGMIQGNQARLNLNAGIYYYSVQAIDTGFVGSEFSQEYSFTVNHLPVPGNDGLITVYGAWGSDQAK